MIPPVRAAIVNKTQASPARLHRHKGQINNGLRINICISQAMYQVSSMHLNYDKIIIKFKKSFNGVPFVVEYFTKKFVLLNL